MSKRYCGGNRRCNVIVEHIADPSKALHLTAIPLRFIAAGELGRSPLRFAPGECGAEPVPLPVAPLRENQGHETDRFAAAQPRISSRLLPQKPAMLSEKETRLLQDKALRNDGLRKLVLSLRAERSNLKGFQFHRELLPTLT